MKNLKLYEDFDFKDEDFDYEEEYPEIKEGDKFYVDIDALNKRYSWTTYFQKDTQYIVDHIDMDPLKKIKCIYVYDGYYVPYKFCYK